MSGSRSFVAQIHVTVTVYSPEEIHALAEVLTQFAAAQHPPTVPAPSPTLDPDLPPTEILNALFCAEIAQSQMDDLPEE